MTDYSNDARATLHAITAADQAILDAFGARRREFEETFDIDMTREEEDAYFARLDAYEGVLLDTAATTIAGVIAKLRIVFMHKDGSAWADRAIMDPSHPEFVAGLAEEDMFTRMKWSAIEDLARIGGVNLATQGCGSAPPASPFEARRLEYLDLDREMSATVTDADNDPRFFAVQARMKQIEGEMTGEPAQAAADARTKLRFMLDTDRIGVPLDGQEAHILVKDAARFLLDGEVGA